jgi:2-hydroxy-3-oxopropionate reductase
MIEVNRDMVDSVSVLGLGPMGAPIARNLLASFARVTVWNRTVAKAQELVALGACVAQTPRDAARAVTLTVLPDLHHVEALLGGGTGLLAGWAERGIDSPVLVVHGTVSPVRVAELSRSLWDQHRIRVIDAPLSGGSVGAANGTLSIMIGGDEDTAAELIPLFARYSRTIRYRGPSGSGQLAKACNQIVVAATVAAVSESMLLARTAGLDLAVLQEILQGGLARTEVLEQKGNKWPNEDFDEGGSARNQLNDLRFALDAGSAQQINLPTTRRVTELFAQMVADGEGDLDHAGLYRTIQRSAPSPVGGPCLIWTSSTHTTTSRI